MLGFSVVARANASQRKGSVGESEGKPPARINRKVFCIPEEVDNLGIRPLERGSGSSNPKASKEKAYHPPRGRG